MTMLNENQKKAVEKFKGNTAVIATAGSGKTTVITERIKRLITYHNVPPENILAVTFSRKAKENISDRLGKEYSKVHIETFHSLALKIIQERSDVRYAIINATWQKENYLFDVCKKLKLCKKKEDMPLNELLSFIAKQKLNMATADDLIYEDCCYSNDIMKQIYISYEEYKARHNLIEFDDFLNIVCDIFKNQPSILEKYQDKFEYILVDEFQDVCFNQAVFLKYLSSKNNNLFVVGDGCQAIYQFRGGQSKYLLDFDNEWSGVETINLDTNYRCSTDIVAAANKLAEYLPESKNKHYVEAKAKRNNISRPVFIQCDTTAEEADRVASEILSIVSEGKYSYKDIAVLSRTNAQLQNIESKFVQKNISYITLGGSSFIDIPEIKLVFSYIKLAYGRKTDSAFKYLYNKPNRWLDKNFLDEISALAKKEQSSLYEAMLKYNDGNWKYENGINEIKSIINQLQSKQFDSIGDAVEFIRKRLNIDDYVTRGKTSDDGLQTEQVENLDNFEQTCKQFSTYSDFIKFIKEIHDGNKVSGDEDNAVSLMTIHKSKGLEFPIVFIIGCNDGLLPHKKTEDVEDEKRLFYVGITRAMDMLYLTSCTHYNSSQMEVSPFIDLLENTIKKSKE